MSLAESPGIDRLTFQSPGFGRRLLGRLFRFGRQIGGEPVDDAAFQRHRTIPLSNQLGCDVRARELVRIRIVDDDLAIARERRRARAFGAIAYGAGQLDRAVFVRVFQPRVDNHRLSPGVEPLLQIFSGNPRNGHGVL